jgi:hypothetical protein
MLLKWYKHVDIYMIFNSIHVYVILFYEKRFLERNLSL